MNWPPYSPDLNPIEHCWFPLKENVYITFPELLDLRGGRSRIEKELGEACLAAWDTLKDELFESLVCSMPDRVEAVINAKGVYTRF